MTPTSLPAEPAKKLYDHNMSGLRAGKTMQGPKRQHFISPGPPQWALQPQQCREAFHLHLQAIHREMLDSLPICQEHHHLPLLQRSQSMKHNPRVHMPMIRHFPEVKGPLIPEKVPWRGSPPRWRMTLKARIHHLHHGEKSHQHLNKVSHNTPRLLLYLLPAEQFPDNPWKYNDKVSVDEGPWMPLDYPASKALLRVTLTWVKIVDGGPNQTRCLQSFGIDEI